MVQIKKSYEQNQATPASTSVFFEAPERQKQLDGEEETNENE